MIRRLRRDSVLIRRLTALSWQADRIGTATTIVLMAVVSIGSIGVAQAQRWIIDGLRHPAGGAGWLAAPVAFGVVAHTASMVGVRVAYNTRAGVTHKVGVRLTDEILAEVSRVPTIAHLERAEYLDRIHLSVNGTQALAAFGWGVLETAQVLAELALTLWVLATVHPALLLLVATTVPVLLLGNRAQAGIRALKDATAHTSRQELALHALCLDAAAAKELWISGAGPEISRRAARLWDADTRRESRVRARGAALETIGWVVNAGGLTAALILVSRQVHGGAAGIGALVLVLATAARMRFQLQLTMANAARAADGGRVAEHYRWLRDYTAQHGTAHGAARAAVLPAELREGIRLDGVSFAYGPDGRTVLDTVDLDLRAGSVIGLVGINGAGKSTFVKLLAGLYRPSCGRILVDGVDLAAVEPETWFARTSGVFQDFSKFELPLAQTVGVGDLTRIDDPDAISTALDQAGATVIVERLPQGVDTQLGATFDGAQLSPGQWQRLALARGLMRRTPLLVILDEPTAALDPQAEHQLFETFASHARAMAATTGAITVLVSHRFSTVSMADHVIVLDAGRVAESGAHADLLTSGGRYAELFRTQAEAYA